MSYCEWFSSSALQKKYHEEWGTPLHEDKMLFEYLSMEVMQCGLNFGLVLKKRNILRQCFDDFDFDSVAQYNKEDIQRILHTGEMIHSEPKIKAIIANANAFQKIRMRYGSFSDYLWSFTDHKTIIYKGHETGLIPSSNALSNTISEDLKKKGLKYVGPVVMYSYLQACGIINDHAADCPKRKYIMEQYPTIVKRRYGEKGLKQY